MNKNQKGFGIIGFLAIIAIIGLICAVGWMFWQNVVKPDANGNPATSSTPTPEPVSLDKPNVTSLDQ